jgi:deferrochelatase/peroxidase EfeB
VNRRAFLRRSALLGAAGLVGGTDAATGDPEPDALAARVGFTGAHQAGIVTPPADQSTVTALDAIAVSRAELVTALQQLSSQAQSLSRGYRFAVRDRSDPPPDSGMLGTTVAPDGLTVTIGFGASLFDHRYGLRDRRPEGLTRMPRFADDEIDAARAHGDVLVTLNAHQRDTLVHALRELLRPVRGAFAIRWTLDGFLGADRGPGARRNLFGFHDGTANPVGAVRDRAVWRPDGGTFQVVRTIRMHTEFWDRVGLREQETMIGRTRDTGAKLAPVPGDAHIRLARPGDVRILRRAFNYHRGVDADGQLDQGLLFLAYNASLQDQFEVVQRRLAGEPMTDYVTPVGGGYYYVPGGARSDADWVGSTLLA